MTDGEEADERRSGKLRIVKHDKGNEGFALLQKKLIIII